MTLAGWWFLILFINQDSCNQTTMPMGPYPSKAFCEKARDQHYYIKDRLPACYTDMDGGATWLLEDCTGYQTTKETHRGK